MELELTCSACNKYYNNPIILPCSDSICMACALRLQAPFTSHDDISRVDYPDIDKMSIYSEADSGVSMGTNSSRPSSYLAISTPNLLAHELCSSIIVCPNKVCKKICYLNEQGVAGLPKNRVLENIVEKYQTTKDFTVACQSCKGEQKSTAVTMCEQCELFYCDKCRDELHPLRGPLAQHSLVNPLAGRSILRQRNREKEAKCKHHPEEVLNMHCQICRESICYVCLQEGSSHQNHDVQATAMLSKSHKVSLEVPR